MANPVPIPYQTPIANLPKAGGSIVRGKGGRSPGSPERPNTDPHANFCTQPWLKWFQFLNELATTSPVFQDASTTDAWKNDFSQEDFWSNVPGPGASPPASWDIVNAEANHPGIQRLLTDVNNGDITSAFFPVAAAAGSVRWDQISTVTLNFKTSATITTSRFECGISDDARANWPASAFEFGANMVYAFYDTAVDNNLHFRMRTGAVLQSDIAVLTPCPVDTWLKFIFQRRLLGSSYVMDVIFRQGDAGTDTQITTLTTGLPADSTAFGGFFRVGTRAAAARDLFVDRFLMPIPNSPPLAR